MLTFLPASLADGEALASLRVAAMRASLERIGRYDPQRARDRFLATFDPARTWQLRHDDTLAGFYVLRPQADYLLLDHLYLAPGYQRQGMGAAVLARVFAEADATRQSVRVGALRDSEANRFYVRHGFVPDGEEEFDLYYRRAPAP
ncbi:GNAT family N-acetyltransferase [Janthinobacterium sp. SUN206]|uniref:GNAT family N-acetyltransferase n=1 Tax=Janthinobacterium sp. SUN206 TaxID=3014787 RepID=UPI0027137318|nr:GNAT family N-acetyltransferase [Janthinobacterium sp. SUN206]MDO8067351.1 GNAT family N-acetyltransferase [Janthinobacterium sp. SUN206]